MNGSICVPEKEPLAQSRISSLAKKIAAETEKLEAYMKLHGVPAPGLSADALTDFYDDGKGIMKMREEIASASNEMLNLMKGPKEIIRWTPLRSLDSVSLQIIYKYGLAQLVPLDAPISLKELQTKTTLDAVNLARTLRHAITNHIFHEPTPGFIAHSAASRLLAADQTTQDWVGFCCEEAFPASAHVVEALEKSPEAVSLTHTAFNYAFGTVGKEPFYVTAGKDEFKAKRFGNAMTSFANGEGYEVSHLVNNWDLSDVDERGGTIVDVGGSHGFIMSHLAKKWKKTKFIIQDTPATVASAPNPICEDEMVSSRIEFQAHDFFKEQPVKNADVYFFRWIMHNHSSPYVLSILRSLIPALKPGARVVINEHCLSESGKEKPWDEKQIRDMDMLMLTMLNAEERDEMSFRKLFEVADSRFEFKGVQRYENYRMGIIEAVWNPESERPVENGA